jgi:hypothetical protein
MTAEGGRPLGRDSMRQVGGSFVARMRNASLDARSFVRNMRVSGITTSCNQRYCEQGG